jgi:hypothetical protein
MKAVLADAAATFPESKRTSTMMAEMASQILAGAAKGERDPATLKIAALSALVECSHYSHDISPERRAVCGGSARLEDLQARLEMWLTPDRQFDYFEAVGIAVVVGAIVLVCALLLY